MRLPDPRKCLPPDGVYAVRVELDGESHDGMANLGPRPTFGDEERGLESHLLDWGGQDLYGARPLSEFVAWLRPTVRFDGPARLAEQLELDRRAAIEALGRSRKTSGGVV